MKLMHAGVVAGALWLAAAGPAAAEDFKWEGRLGAGQMVEVKGINGEVRASAASGPEVLVTATKRGRRSDPEEVRIEVVEHRQGVTICAVYPSPSWREPNECRPGEGGRMHTRDNDVEVEFTVHVPAGVGFVGRTVNGDVEARSLDTDVEAYTVNGSIQISTNGVARAETVNGSIRASFGQAKWSGELDLTTVNGSITVELPEAAGAKVQARTVNGHIDTDFPLTVQGRFGRHRLSGTIGDGGGELNLETVNGGIRLKKAS